MRLVRPFSASIHHMVTLWYPYKLDCEKTTMNRASLLSQNDGDGLFPRAVQQLKLLHKVDTISHFLNPMADI